MRFQKCSRFLGRFVNFIGISIKTARVFKPSPVFLTISETVIYKLRKTGKRKIMRNAENAPENVGECSGRVRGMFQMTTENL